MQPHPETAQQHACERAPSLCAAVGNVPSELERRSGSPAVRRSGGPEAGRGPRAVFFYLSGCTMVDFVCRHLPRSRVFSPADSLRCRSHRPVVRRSGEAVRRPPRSARTANGPAPDRHLSLEGRSGGPAVRSGPEVGGGPEGAGPVH